MAYFLEYLQKNDAPLFNVANELFWGSIIAGFLKRENPDLEKVYNGDKQEYYLDTPLVMSLLDLATEENKAYAEEMLSIIVSSGCIARIHPMTIREISNILHTVEKNTCPWPNTPIAFAYERRKLNAAKLAAIRVSLATTLDKMKVSVMPAISDRELDKTISVYKKKSVVQSLARERGDNRTGEDGIREVHDIFMYDYIRERRKSSKNTFFVTLNSDLITYCRAIHDIKDFGFINPNKIVLEMWMHNSANTDVRGKALTQTMARCLVLNNRDIRHKLNIVAHFYNESLKGFEPEAYRAIILGLYKRDKELINGIQQIETQGHESTDDAENRRKMVQLAERALKKEKSRKSRFASIQEQLDALQKDNADIRSLMAMTQSDKQKAQEEIDSLNNDKEKQDKLITLLKDKNDLSDCLNKKEKQLNTLEEEFKESLSYKRYYLIVSLPIVTLFVIAALIVAALYLDSTLVTTFVCGVIVALLTFIWNWVEKYGFNFKEVRNEVRNSQRAQWEQSHPEYGKLQNEISDLHGKIKEIEGRIEDLGTDR